MLRQKVMLVTFLIHRHLKFFCPNNNKAPTSQPTGRIIIVWITRKMPLLLLTVLGLFRHYLVKQMVVSYQRLSEEALAVIIVTSQKTIYQKQNQHLS